MVKGPSEVQQAYDTFCPSYHRDKTPLSCYTGTTDAARKDLVEVELVVAYLPLETMSSPLGATSSPQLSLCSLSGRCSQETSNEWWSFLFLACW